MFSCFKFLALGFGGFKNSHLQSNIQEIKKHEEDKPDHHNLISICEVLPAKFSLILRLFVHFFHRTWQ